MNTPGVWNNMSRGRGGVQLHDGQGFIKWAPEMGSKFPLVGSLKTPFCHARTTICTEEVVPLGGSVHLLMVSICTFDLRHIHALFVHVDCKHLVSGVVLLSHVVLSACLCVTHLLLCFVVVVFYLPHGLIAAIETLPARSQLVVPSAAEIQCM